MLPQEKKDKLIVLLAHIYNAVPWAKMRGRYSVDVFSHRVVACATRRTLPEAISKLCGFFGLQSIPPEALRLVEELKGDEREILAELYSSGVYYATAAAIKAKEFRLTKTIKEG
jgi:hypothetical protein